MFDLVTVIIPVYNAQETLKKALESVINQTYCNLEIIAIDDGSIDKSAVILDEMAKADCRIKVLHKKNGGQSSARNLGLKNATGKYIQFLDSDDWLQTNAIECALNSIRSNKRIDFVLYGFNVYDGQCKLRTPNAGDFLYFVQEGYDKFKPIHKLMASPCNKFFKRSYISYFFEEERNFGEDAIFNYKNLNQKTCIKCISECLYNVQINTIGSVNKRFKNGKINDLLDSLFIEESKLTELFSLEINIQNIRTISLALTAKFVESAFCCLGRKQAIAECEKLKQKAYFEVLTDYNKYCPLHHRITIWLLMKKWYYILNVYSHQLFMLKRFCEQVKDK